VLTRARQALQETKAAI
jgi:chromosome segregation protein